MPTDRRDLRRRLFALASEQAGYFTAAQAKESATRTRPRLTMSQPATGCGSTAACSGWPNGSPTSTTISSAGRCGRRDEPSSRMRRRSRSTASASSSRPRIHLTVPPGFTMRDNAVVLHYADLADRRRASSDAGFASPRPARSLIDVAATGTRRRSTRSRAIEEALDSGPRQLPISCEHEPRPSMLAQRSTSSARSIAATADDLRHSAGAANWPRGTDSRTCRRRPDRSRPASPTACSSNGSSRASRSPNRDSGCSKAAWPLRSAWATARA